MVLNAPLLLKLDRIAAKGLTLIEGKTADSNRIGAINLYPSGVVPPDLLSERP